MSHLRLVRSSRESHAPENACLTAFERELDYIFATLHRLGAPRHDAEDLAQEVFVILHRNWENLDLGRPLRPYMFGIAFRVVSAQRRRKSREVLISDWATCDGTLDTLDPEGKLRSKQSLALLQTALESIPLTRRAVVIMHDLDEIPIVEIARHLAITRFGAYARLRQGRKELAAAVRRVLRGALRT